ncbi:hypothetical protein SEA_LIGMA_23 [Gordonia phage Ligma]|nr:hypothetical protein SEA_LIGMA_23 [Gordonia phage Ligma]UQT02124.1 hypothetical protein SEA_AXUMITE_23 [Gordonia phage Axumite]
MTTYSADRLLHATDPGDTAETPTSDAVFGAPAEPTPAPPTVSGEPQPPTDEALDGEIVRTDEVAVPGETPWEHELLEFKGDTLEVRAPSDQALTAFSLASGRFVPMDIKNDVVGLFVAKHLSPKSYGQVFTRLMDPDDDGYNPETIGDLMRSIVGISVEKRKAAEEAAKKAGDSTPSAS